LKGCFTDKMADCYCRARQGDLKMNSASMKSTELRILERLVKVGEERPLCTADLAERCVFVLRFRNMRQPMQKHGRR
jgi:hypothetical protein